MYASMDIKKSADRKAIHRHMPYAKDIPKKYSVWFKLPSGLKYSSGGGRRGGGGVCG